MAATGDIGEAVRYAEMLVDLERLEHGLVDDDELRDKWEPPGWSRKEP